MRNRRSAFHFTRHNDSRDRIEKAVALINGQQVTPQTEGSFLVYSEAEDRNYRTTLVSCECQDFHFNTNLCKHQWASWGAAAALLVTHIRRACTFRELELCAAAATDDLCNVPESFLAVVRDEYRKRLEFIYKSERRIA